MNEPIITILNTILYHVLYFRDLKPDNILIGDDGNIKIAGKESSLVITSINYSFSEIHRYFFIFASCSVREIRLAWYDTEFKYAGIITTTDEKLQKM